MTSNPACIGGCCVTNNQPTPILGERRIQIQSGIRYVSVTNSTSVSYLSGLDVSLLTTSTPAGLTQIWSGLGPTAEGESSLTAISLPSPMWVTTFLPVSTVNCSISLGGAIVKCRTSSSHITRDFLWIKWIRGGNRAEYGRSASRNTIDLFVSWIT